jgi:FAD/FMN-containing dehydrogenase
MATPQEIAQQLVDSFNNRTYEQDAAMFYTDNTVFVDLPTGREDRGIAAGIQSSAVWVQAFPDARAEVISHEVNGNTVTTTIRGGGTFTGQMAAPDGSMIPGNGSTLDLEYVQTIHLEGDTVVRQEANYDMQAMMGQLGLG